MAFQEGTSLIERAYVISIVPDVCWTPMGPIQVPVPYIIIARFSDSVAVSSTVRFAKNPCFILKSSISRCTGDEAGVGGGIVSGTFASVCEPIENGATVSADGAHIVRHGDPFWMNKKNTLGVVVFPESLGPVESSEEEEEGWFDWLSRKTKELKLIERGMGAAQVAGGVVATAAGAVGLAAPTGVTQVAGGAAVLYGADSIYTGAKQVYSGEWQDTLTQQAATAVGGETFGEAVDFAAGAVNPSNIGRKVVKEGVEELSEKVVKEGIEEGSEKAVKEGVEELSEKVVKEGIEEGSEKAVKEGIEGAAGKGSGKPGGTTVSLSKPRQNRKPSRRNKKIDHSKTTRNPDGSVTYTDTKGRQVTYSKDGFADFSPHAEAEVKIDGLTGDRSDFAKANKAVGLKSTPEGYTWHHVQDGKTMQLIPTDIHQTFPHTGGAAVLKGQ